MSDHYLALVDTHTLGPRNDVTPVFGNYQAFAALVADLAAPFAGQHIDLVAGIDALGFILGTALAWHLGKGFVPLRKGGKLPVAADQADFVDYTGQPKALELRRGALAPGARVLLVDEWIETGAQVKAAIRLIEGQGGVVIGVATINADRNEATRPLFESYPIHGVWPDEG